MYKRQEKKRRALTDYYLHQAAPLEIEQEYYILFGDHGSNSCGIRQELLEMCIRDRCDAGQNGAAGE